MTRKGGRLRRWFSGAKHAARPPGKSGGHEGEVRWDARMRGSGDPGRREKLRREGVSPPVPQTDTGGQVENTKAIERILVKELGKSLPFLRFKGDPRW